MAVMNAVFEELIAGANVFVLVVLAPAMKGLGITEAKLPDHLPCCCVESHWLGSSWNNPLPVLQLIGFLLSPPIAVIAAKIELSTSGRGLGPSRR